MNFWNKKIAVLAMIGAFILGGAAVSQSAQGDQVPQYGQQLTPEQLAQARKILDENYAQMEQTRQALNAKRYQLDSELSNPSPDSARIAALSREIGELRGEMLAARSEARNRLAQQGLPPDGFGPCWGWNGMGMGMMYGPGYYGPGYGAYHHGWGHHGRGGWRGGCGGWR